jgi:uncharacterized protein YecE (DUF72 family)
MAADIRIGTSGWVYKHWVGRFYPARWPASKMLAWYQGRFDTVEINNSFYRLPSEAALEGWRMSSPENFRFAVKGSRFVTHMKKLKDPAPGLAKLFSRMDLLGEKLGPVLFQLPPNFGVNVPRLTGFLKALPSWHRYAFEFRDASWNSAEVYQVLRERNIAWCVYDLAGYQSPVEITADIAYVRLHGPGGKYQGSYDDGALGSWARRIEEWRDSLKAVYVYFDNDDSAYAAHNAMRLRDLVKQMVHS